MKRLLKKAFPGIFDVVTWERLLVIPQAIAQFEQMKLEEDRTFPGLSNLYICGGHVKSPQRNIGAAIESASSIGLSLGVGTPLEPSTKDSLNEETL